LAVQKGQQPPWVVWATVLSWGDPGLRTLREVAGIDRVVLGSDNPYLRRELAVPVASTSKQAESERTAVLGGTAAELIPRLARLRSETQYRAWALDPAVVS
jgi:hypothetical protein